jgi:hypothetical protein
VGDSDLRFAVIDSFPKFAALVTDSHAATPTTSGQRPARHGTAPASGHPNHPFAPFGLAVTPITAVFSIDFPKGLSLLEAAESGTSDALKIARASGAAVGDSDLRFAVINSFPKFDAIVTDSHAATPTTSDQRPATSDQRPAASDRHGTARNGPGLRPSKPLVRAIWARRNSNNRSIFHRFSQGTVPLGGR